MELKEFITKVLTDVVDAVSESQVYAKEKGAIVAPSKNKLYIAKNPGSYSKGAEDINPSEITFKVILTDKGTKNKGGGIGVSFGSFGAKYSKDKGSESEQSTQVSFSIPLFYPHQED